MSLSVCREFGRYFEVCVNFDECRGPNGLRRAAGLMAFAIFMAQCAGRESQRSQARWLKIEWSWILYLWQTGGGVPPSSTKPPLQSDISRFEKTIPADIFAIAVDTEERRFLAKMLKNRDQKEEKLVEKVDGAKKNASC